MASHRVKRVYPMQLGLMILLADARLGPGRKSRKAKALLCHLLADSLPVRLAVT